MNQFGVQGAKLKAMALTPEMPGSTPAAELAAAVPTRLAGSGSA